MTTTDLQLLLGEIQRDLDFCRQMFGYHIGRCFLVSDGLLAHIRAQASPHLSGNGLGGSMIGWARPDILDRPEVEHQFYTSDWKGQGVTDPKNQTWWWVTNKKIGSLCERLNTAAIPGWPSRHQGVTWAKAIGATWNSLTRSLEWQTAHWGSENARFNSAPEQYYMKLHLLLEQLRDWPSAALAAIQYHARIQAETQAAAVLAAKSTKRRGNRQAEIWGAMKKLSDAGLTVSREAVAAQVGLSKSALSKPPNSEYYREGLTMLPHGTVFRGTKDHQGRIEAVAAEE